MSDSININGHNYHLLWLRENCLCESCTENGSMQKIYDFSNSSSMPKLLSHTIEKNALKIIWNESPEHISIYSTDLLDLYAYDNTVQDAQLYDEEILWDAASIPSIIKNIECPLNDQKKYLNSIRKYGFALIKNIDDYQADELMDSIGPRVNTEFGAVADITFSKDIDDLGTRGVALFPHTDYTPYMYAYPTLQSLYCLKNSVKGGDNLLIDGFKLVDDFRKENPQNFLLLCQLEFHFQQFFTNWKYFFRRKRKIIELDQNGKVVGIHFGHSHSYFWQLPYEKMLEGYEAYRKFMQYVKNDKYVYRFNLQSKEVLLFQNGRILHGRDSYDINSGERHLRARYVSFEHVLARLNYHDHKEVYKDQFNEEELCKMK